MVSKITVGVLAAALASVVFATAAWAEDGDDLDARIREIVKEETAAGGNLRVYWKNGLNLENADKSVRLKMGGRIFLDSWFFDDDDFNAIGVPSSNQEDGVEFRAVRLFNSGLINDHIEYKLQVDFSHAEISFRDMYFGFVNLSDCWGCAFPDIRIGNQFVPVIMDANLSGKYTMFMERALIAAAFGHAARRNSFKIHDSLRGDQLNYAFSVFSPTSDSSKGGDFDYDDGWAVAGRVTYAPWWDCSCECRRWQVGVSAAYYDDLQGRRFRSRAPSHLTSRYLDTGTIADVESYYTIAFETALVYGPWYLQAEYAINPVESASTGDPTFSGWYVQLSYFLTGECKRLKHSLPVRQKVCCDFLANDCCCSGAWELAARAEGLDLRDAGIDGGEMLAFTFGVNWYLNPNARIMFNYFIASVDGTPAGFDADGPPPAMGPPNMPAGSTTFNDDTVSGFGVRFQVDW